MLWRNYRVFYFLTDICIGGGVMKRSVSLVDLKGLNKNSVYNYIYREREASKQQIVQGLNMGLSTVSQNIRLLEDAGLIERSGSFGSTGGRKADIIRIVRDARIAIGVGILKKAVYIVAVDLYGEVLQSTVIDQAYECNTDYYTMLGASISDFVAQHGWQKASVLGVSIATQGTISADGESVDYGKIMNNYDMRLADFANHIPYPCRLEHDSKAAAYLELWNNPGVKDAVVLLLNRNFGGSLIIDRKIVKGSHMHAGAIEHLCISREGPLCYCGNRGCIETYCSANALEDAAACSAKQFFEVLRRSRDVVGAQGAGEARGNKQTPVAGQSDDLNFEAIISEFERIWEDYLDKLAFAIRNLSVIVDGSIIISGYLATYFTREDVDKLLAIINSPPFPISRDQIIVGTFGQYAPAVGAALYYLDQFRKSV